MSQTFLFASLQLLGTLVALTSGPRDRVVLACAVGFPAGLALMVPIVLLLATLGVYTSVAAIAAVLAIAAACVAVLRRDPTVDRRAVRTIGSWMAGFVVICTAATHPNLSFLTYDSHTIVMLGGMTFDDHGFAPGVLHQLADWGVFQVLAHSGVGFTRQTYLYSLSFVLGLSAIAMFAVVLQLAVAALRRDAQVDRRSERWLVAAVTATAFSVYMVSRHFFYIHTNLGSAVYLLGFVALFWIAEVTRDARYLPMSFLFLLALALHRIENPIINAAFLSMILLPSKLPPKRVLVTLAGYTAITSAWYLLLSTAVPKETQFLTPTKCYATVGVLLLFLAYASATLLTQHRWLLRLNRMIPAAAIVVIVAGLFYAFEAKPEHMKISYGPWKHNMIAAPFWEGAWPAIAVIAFIGLFLAAPPAKEVFVYGIPMYFGLTLLIVYGRDPYRISAGDSAARMALHLIPMTFFYFGIKFLPSLTTLVGRSATEATQGAPS